MRNGISFGEVSRKTKTPNLYTIWKEGIEQGIIRHLVVDYGTSVNPEPCSGHCNEEGSGRMKSKEDIEGSRFSPGTVTVERLICIPCTLTRNIPLFNRTAAASLHFSFALYLNANAQMVYVRPRIPFSLSFLVISYLPFVPCHHPIPTLQYLQVFRLASPRYCRPYPVVFQAS